MLVRRYFAVHQCLLIKLDKSHVLFLILPYTVLNPLLEFTTKKKVTIFFMANIMMAYIFMCYFEEKWVMTKNALPSIWFRYVDDIFAMLDSKDAALIFFAFHGDVKVHFFALGEKHFS